VRGQHGGDELDGFGWGLEGGPAGGSGEQDVARFEGLEPGQCGESPRRANDDVCEELVLPGLAVDGQCEPQPVEVGPVLPVEQDEAWSDRGEGGVGLALVQLSFGQLDIAGADVVRDDEPGDPLVEVGLGDLGADGEVPADDQAEPDLIVQECDVGWAHERVGGAADGA